MWNYLVGLYTRAKLSILSFFQRNAVTIKRTSVWLIMAASGGLVYLATMFYEMSSVTIVLAALKAQWLTLIAFVSSLSVLGLWSSILAWWTSLAASVSTATALSTSAAVAASSVIGAAYVVLVGAVATLLASGWSLIVTTMHYVSIVTVVQSVAYWGAIGICVVAIYNGIMYLGNHNEEPITILAV